MKPETQKILEDLKLAGLDTSSIENQIRTNALAERAADNIIGAGILRQQEFSRAMNDVTQKEQELENQAKQLGTLHDARQFNQLPKETLEVIELLERNLIAAGYDEADVKALSAKGKVAPQPNPNPNPQPNRQVNNPQKIPNQQEFDTSKLVDADTFAKATVQMAMGSINTNIEINSRFNELRQLGITVDRKKADELQKELAAGFATGNADLDTVFDKVFDLEKVRQTKAEEAQKKRDDDLAARVRAETLKEAGIPERTIKRRLASPVFHGSDNAANKVPEEFRDDKGNLDPTKVPTNKYGDVERFRMRGDRTNRVNSAMELNNLIQEKIESDPLYVEG